MKTDFDYRQEFTENYRYAHDFWASFYEDARIYTLAASGYTWSDRERKQLVKEGREPIEYNIMRRPLQFYSGYLRDNIHQVIYEPVEGSDQKTSDQFTKMSYDIWNKNNGYTVFLDACDEALKSGISLCGIQMDYSKDIVNGDISFYKRTYNSFVIDPTFESLDLSDCGFVITRDLVGRHAIKSLIPFVDPQIIDELPNGFRDEKFIQYHPQFTTFSRNRNLVAYDQYYHRSSREREFLVDLKTGFARDITDYPKEEKDKLKMGINRFRQLREDAETLGIEEKEIPALEIRKQDQSYIELCIYLNGEHVWSGMDKTGVHKNYPFVPLLCYFEPSIWMPSQRIQGIASTAWSLQRQFNKRHMKITDMMDSDISTGYKYLIGSVPDVSDLQQSGQNKLIGVDPENAPQGLDSVQELRGGGGTNPSLIQYQQILDQLALTLTNVNESVLGVDKEGNTQISGRLAEVRIGQGLRSNRKVFDNIEQSQRILGRVILECIQNTYPPEKVARMINDEPTDQFYSKEFEQYDVIVAEGVRSKTQRDAYYSELVNLKREGIVDVPESEIIKALPIVGKTDLEEAIEQQMQQRAEQQKKIDAQEQMAMEIANSQKEQNLALAQERRARVVADIGLSKERASEAQENIAQAGLARAKTISEISNMELDKVLRVVEIANRLEMQEAALREAKEEDINRDADQINAETQGSAENVAMQQTITGGGGNG